MTKRLGCIALVLALYAVSGLANEDTSYDAALADSELMPQAAHALFTDIARSGSGAVAVGERGHVMLSSDLKTWNQVKVPTRTLLTSVYAVDADIWAVGHDGVILRSADAGQTWRRQRVETEAEGPLLDVLFLDRENGIAIGAYGQYLTTADGGETWAKELISDRTSDPAVDNAESDQATSEDDELGVASDDMGEDEGDPHLNGIVRINDTLVMVGEAGKGYRSTDRGATWTPFRMPYEGSMFGVIALDDGSVIAYGLRGNVLISKDAGLTWEALYSGTEQSLMGGYAVSGGRAVFVGASGAVALRPSGESSLRVFSFPEGGILAGVLPEADESKFVVVGENGILHYAPN